MSTCVTNEFVVYSVHTNSYRYVSIRTILCANDFVLIRCLLCSSSSLEIVVPWYFRHEIDYYCVVHESGKGLYAYSKGRPEGGSHVPLPCDDVLLERINDLRVDFGLPDLTVSPDAFFYGFFGKTPDISRNGL